MVDIQMIKSRFRWSLFLLIVALIVIIILLVDYTLFIINIHVSSLIISIVAGLCSGAILIIFDIIVFQGFEYEDNRREDRIKEIFIQAMHSSEVRCIIYNEVKRVLEEEKKKVN